MFVKFVGSRELGYASRSLGRAASPALPRSPSTTGVPGNTGNPTCQGAEPAGSAGADTSGQAHQVLIAMPYVDRGSAERCARLMASRAGASGLLLCVHDDDREGYISVVNQVFRLTESPMFGYVAQDAFPGRLWLSTALDAVRTRDHGLFAFNDGKWMGALAGFGLASRQWAEKNYDGDFFYPGYRSHYADVELSLMAMNDRKYCYDPNSLLVEVDWNKDLAAVDLHDRALYKIRKSNGFDGQILSSGLLNLFS